MVTAAPLGFRALPLPLAQLSLAAVLKCGQSFRWSIHPLDAALTAHEYRLCLHDRVVCLRQTSDSIFYRAVFPESVLLGPSEEAAREAETLAWLRDYFQLDIDLLCLYKEWAEKDAVFARLRTRFEGLRMLRQDPWENLVSFICSSNNNISRITKMVKSLCSHYSPSLLSLPLPALSSENESYHPFPPPSLLADPSVPATLRALGFGYRADFIHKTARMLVDAHGAHGGPERWLQTLRAMPTADARAELLKLMGVGRKVADCVLLMSLDKTEVIPVDTHVHQIAIKHYGLRGISGKKPTMSPALYDEINEKLLAVWGTHAGWAQTVLFTADLKSFSLYGLPTPAPTPTPSPSKRRSRASDDAGDDLTVLVPPRPNKRARKMVAVSVANVEPVEVPEIGGVSLAERVKGRRRGVQTPIK
ncbi:DNA glycosylase [Artomyces pyxidatus]|uniref:DNA glycosylase n=1 Tax=Artomyces pyxidatus TaxID=48021 RepID=A0ACB8T8U0_9AGAM|nr:DNA glycosylase [Artomyces pyxidatus]